MSEWFSGVNPQCNYHYAGTELIVIGERKLRCSCGREILYEGKIEAYNPPLQPNLRELTALLRQSHFPLQLEFHFE